MKKNKESKDSILWNFHQNENRSHLLAGIPRQNIFYKNILKLDLKKNSKIVEIGFGNGYLLNKLSKKFTTLIGIDISKKNIDISKKNFKKIQFKLIDVSGQLPFKDNSIDCLIASEVIEHMSNDELSIFKKELKRILKKGGYLIGSVPANEILEENSCFCPNCNINFHKWGHKQSFSKYRILKEFNNFKRIKINYYFNRYVGKNNFEKFIGFIFHVNRIIINKFIRLKFSGFFFIFKNEKK